MDRSVACSRRRFLSGVTAAGAGALAGCMDRIRYRAENGSRSQVSMSIKSVPVDDDVLAATILSDFRENLLDVGIETIHDPVAKAELNREVFLNRDFDIFLVRHNGMTDPDALHGLLHSDYIGETGWQNPFSVSDPNIDELLERQRLQSGHNRQETLQELFDYLNETTPFTTVVYPTELGAITSKITYDQAIVGSIDYLSLLGTTPDEGAWDRPIVVTMFGEGFADRLNPLAVDVEASRPIIDLIYDRLYRYDGSFVPWLVDSISWNMSNGVLTADITLFENLRWHDGEQVDATDVTFTYEFLGDTSLGAVDSGVPAPRFRGRQSVIGAMTEIDTRSVRIQFNTASETIAKRALTLPVLPKHIWEPRSELLDDHWTVALQTDNEDPIGSSVLQITETNSDSVVLEPFVDHPFFAEELADRPEYLEQFSPYTGIEFRRSRNTGAAIDALIDGDADVIGSGLSPADVETVQDASSISLLESDTNSFYMLGFNNRHPELGNHRFRQVLARLIDRQFIVDEHLDGYGTVPTSQSSVLGVTGSTESDRDSPHLSFPGTDGNVDTDRVRRMFEDVGYRYSDDELLE